MCKGVKKSIDARNAYVTQFGDKKNPKEGYDESKYDLLHKAMNNARSAKQRCASKSRTKTLKNVWRVFSVYADI